MNFLNKKHVQTFANTTSHFPSHQQSASKGFSNLQQELHHPPPHPSVTSYIGNRLQQQHKGSRVKQPPRNLQPSVSSSRIKNQQPPYSSSYTQNFQVKKSSSTLNIPPVMNLCQQHENQVLRHLCLQCNQPLCSQCISDHLSDHRETTKSVPKIETINKLRKQMNIKAQKMLQFMQENNPKMILKDVSQLKFDAIAKIHEMKSQVIRVFEKWCKVLENHVVDDLIKTGELETLSGEMGKIREEVLTLYDDMGNQQTVPVETVKKLHQIDSEKLQAAYLEMFNRFSKSILSCKFTFDYNWKSLMQSFEKCLVLRPLHPQVPISVYEPDSQLPPVVFQKKSSKELLNFISSPVVTKEIPQDDYDDEKKFIDIQSIESLVEPMGNQHGERIIIPSGQMVMGERNLSGENENQYQNQQKVERSFSRQGSGKRLAIFTAQQQRPQSQIRQN